jgi:predicted glycosyltransferase involved in capsule biosynthesis
MSSRKVWSCNEKRKRKEHKDELVESNPKEVQLTKKIRAKLLMLLCCTLGRKLWGSFILVEHGMKNIADCQIEERIK